MLAEGDGDGEGCVDTEGTAAARLRAVRLDHGVSLRSLARTIGVSAATLSALENGKVRPTAARVLAIAAALGVPPERLGGAEPERGPAPPGPGTWRVYGPLALDPVLTAALDLFCEVGYHGASVRDIAARAGRSVAGLYHYHPSKQHMLVRILDRTMDDLLDRAGRARAEGRDTVERFALLVENLALFHTQRRMPAFLAASEMRSLDAANRDRITAQRVRVHRMIEAEVADGLAAGVFACRDAGQAARAISTMCTSIVQWYRPEGRRSAAEIALDHVEVALDVVRHGGAPRP